MAVPDEDRAEFFELFRKSMEAYQAKRLEESTTLWRQAVICAEKHADLAVDLVEASMNFGDLQESYGDFEESLAKFSLALEVCGKLSAPASLRAVVRSRLAVNAVNRGDNQSATLLFDDAIAAFEGETEKDLLEYAECLNHYGHLLRSEKKWVASIDAYEKAYKCYPQIKALPENDVRQRRLALRNLLRSTTEQSDDSMRDQLRERISEILPKKGAPGFP